MIQSGQVNIHEPISGIQGHQWNADLSPLQSEAMSRLPSQDSVGANSYNLSDSGANTFDHLGSERMYTSLSQKSLHISSARSDITGRSSPDNFVPYTPRLQQAMDLQTFDHFPYPGREDYQDNSSAYHRDDFKLDLTSNGLTSDSSYSMFPNSGESFAPLSVDVPVTSDSMSYDAKMLHESPVWTIAAFPESQRSSPTLKEWPLPEPQMVSTTSSPLEYDYSPSLESLSPNVQDYPDISDIPPYTASDRVLRKPIGPRQSKVTSDMAARNQRFPGTSEGSDQSMRFVGRSNLEVDNTARDHPYYHNVSVQADGLYHCPWEGQEGCSHKPEKLKCNYEYEFSISRPHVFNANSFACNSKSVDSHLKPYKCKVHACENSKFSSTACLLRHEREAHAMHGHGDKPYLCTYEGCERGAAGNGFPRHWNLCDHMKRVHNHPGPTKSSGSGSPPPSNGSNRGKNKRKAEVSEPTPVEKAIKRIATPPVAVRQEPSLMDHYHQSERKLLDVVKRLHDPRNARNMEMLRNASDCIKVMAQTTQRINTAPTMERNSSQQSG